MQTECTLQWIYIYIYIYNVTAIFYLSLYDNAFRSRARSYCAKQNVIAIFLYSHGDFKTRALYQVKVAIQLYAMVANTSKSQEIAPPKMFMFRDDLAIAPILPTVRRATLLYGRKCCEEDVRNCGSYSIVQYCKT